MKKTDLPLDNSSKSKTQLLKQKLLAKEKQFNFNINIVDTDHEYIYPLLHNDNTNIVYNIYCSSIELSEEYSIFNPSTYQDDSEIYYCKGWNEIETIINFIVEHPEMYNLNSQGDYLDHCHLNLEDIDESHLAVYDDDDETDDIDR